MRHRRQWKAAHASCLAFPDFVGFPLLYPPGSPLLSSHLPPISRASPAPSRLAWSCLMLSSLLFCSRLFLVEYAGRWGFPYRKPRPYGPCGRVESKGDGGAWSGRICHLPSHDTFSGNLGFAATVTSTGCLSQRRRCACSCFNS